jgi:hypothetical protein
MSQFHLFTPYWIIEEIHINYRSNKHPTAYALAAPSIAGARNVRIILPLAPACEGNEIGGMFFAAN